MKIPSITQKVLLLFFTFSLVLLCSSSSIAAVRTVSNNPQSPGQFTNLQQACDAASSNDTIYVHGSPTIYDGVFVRKPLTLIGAGALPNKINNYFPTMIFSVQFTFNTTDTVNGSGSRVYGIKVLDYIVFGGNSGNTAFVHNIILSRNYIAGISFSSSLSSPQHGAIIINNNIIGSNGITGNQGALAGVYIRNNIIRGGSINSLGNASVGTLTISNNVLNGCHISNTKRANIYNNIFYKANVPNPVPKDDPTFGYLHYNSISYNLFVSSTLTYNTTDIINGTNAGGNNILNFDPQFVNDDSGYPVSLYDYNNPSSNFADFHLLPNSPCLGAASADGTQMGIYGGVSPFFEGSPANSRYRYFPMPNIPVMLDMNINNSAVLPNGTLNVEFKARKQN